jgi:ankyrin repeat protein
MNLDDSRWLLEKGADPNLVDDRGNSTLHVATNHSRHGAKFVRLFLEHGADPNLRCRTISMNEEAPTHPLELLEGLNSPEVDQLLRDYGAEISESAY